jgi:sugar diacid utilization regulator
MANKLFQVARNAVQQAVGRIQNAANEMNNNQMMNNQTTHTNLSGHDREVAQNAISSAMANSSDAERAQLAELQQELDSHSNHSQNAQTGQPSSFSQAAGMSLKDAQNLLEDGQDQNKLQ